MILKDRIAQWLKGHQAAIEFVLAVHEIVELWDDLIDKDPASDDRVNAAFYLALITLPRNRFYQDNLGLLNPLIESAVFDWWTANKFEAERKQLHTAFMLKTGIHTIITMSARIVGGVDWAKQVNDDMRSLGETWEQYSKEFGVS